MDVVEKNLAGLLDRIGGANPSVCPHFQFKAIIVRTLTDTAVVVTRIFGGTKLGVGGLIRAYGSAAAEGLAAATIQDIVRQVVGAKAQEAKNLAILQADAKKLEGTASGKTES